MRIGIEKMKLAHKKKVAIKVFNPDRSNKTGECAAVPLSHTLRAPPHSGRGRGHDIWDGVPSAGGQEPFRRES